VVSLSGICGEGGWGRYDMKSSMWAFVSCLFSFLLRVLRKEVRPGGAVGLGPIFCFILRMYRTVGE